MRTVVCVGGAAILLVILATRAVAQGCPDVTGCWEGDYTGNFSGTLDISFEQTGDQLSGVVTAHDANFGTFNGSLFGTAVCDSLSFATFFADFSALVTGNCMAGTYTVLLGGGGSGTWQACQVPCCGNGSIQPTETCDDGNTTAGDGCSDTCMVESGFSCVGQPSVCTPLVCGNGVIQPGEECDDGNMASGDGCSATCMLEPGFQCSGEPTVCVAIVCGNGVIQPGEECDDGNMASGDGCSATCMLEPGFQCSGEPTVCVAIVCGNGLVQPGEACDDGNTAAGDGCSATCTVESGFTCSGQPSVCIPIVCGNGVVQPDEACDDGNTATDDCCHPDCTKDPAGTECTSLPVPGVCDASGNCVAIPTLSEWGVILLSLLMLAAVLYDRRQGIAVDRC